MMYCPNCGCPCEETETICLLCNSQLQFSPNTLSSDSNEIIPQPSPKRKFSQSTTYSKRKAKRVMLIAVAMIVICALLSGVALFLMSHKSGGDSSIKEVLWSKVEENITISQNADGTNTISVLSPDYSQILLLIAQENPEQEITANLLQKAIAAHPELKTTYSFQVSNTEPETVRAAFEESVAKEILILSILEMPVNAGER